MPSIIKRDAERHSFQVYVTDTLHVIAENTAVPAAGFSEGKAGKTMTKRWADLGKPEPPEDKRTPEEVIDGILGKLSALNADKEGG